MKIRKKSKLRFDTEKNVRTLRFKRFAAAFSCFFILVAGVSFLFMLNHYDFNLSAVFTPADTQETEPETSTQPAPAVEGVRNYLLVCTADNSNAVRFASIVTADMNKKTVCIKGLDTSANVTVAGCTGNFEKQLDYGGIAQLELAVETMSGLTIDKYITSTDSKFRSVTDYVGEFDIDVENSVNIRTDSLTAVIGAGRQTMNGDTMLKYIRSFEGNPQKQAELIAEILEQSITPSNLQKADRLYERIINKTESNISVLDFSSIKVSFEALLYDNGSVSVTVSK